MLREEEEAARTFDGDRSGAAESTVEESGEGKEGLLQRRLETHGYWDECPVLMSSDLEGLFFWQ